MLDVTLRSDGPGAKTAGSQVNLTVEGIFFVLILCMLTFVDINSGRLVQFLSQLLFRTGISIKLHN